MDRNEVTLNLLECLRVLVEEQHVSRAADRLGISQPKLSSALGRLRRTTGDPLLVRTSKGMVPTAFAVQLAALSNEFLQGWDQLAHPAASFSPLAATDLLRVQAMDALVPSVLASAIQQIRMLAPNTSVSIAMPSLGTMREALETGEVDLAIGILPNLPQGLFVSRLGSCYWSCISAASHPRLGKELTIDDYVREHHVVSTFGRPTQLSLTECDVERSLEAMGQRRKAACYASTMLTIPEIVATSDLIGLVPHMIAEQAQRHLPISIWVPPVPMPPHELMLVWHARTQNDRAQQWFRSVLRKAAHLGGRQTAGLAEIARQPSGLSG
jgi:DNA-binding transcriptional LysR family regulator